MIGIYIDNNVWDFLFERGMDLARELPAPEFCLATRDTGSGRHLPRLALHIQDRALPLFRPSLPRIGQNR